MQHSIEDIEYAEYLFDRFYGIGSSDNGGVTRLGYTEVEDEMHDTLRALGDEKGYGNYEDEVGNTYLYDKDCDMDDPYYLIGSHLDSVIEGGRYDHRPDDLKLGQTGSPGTAHPGGRHAL